LPLKCCKLQAQRAHGPGHAFSPDTEWQRAFENAFPYKETPDQAQAIEDAKLDMELEKPMDRLVCGDVGFRQDGSRHPRRLQGHHGRPPGRHHGSDHGPRPAALRHLS
jgi:hypothetical protein